MQLSCRNRKATCRGAAPLLVAIGCLLLLITCGGSTTSSIGTANSSGGMLSVSPSNLEFGQVTPNGRGSTRTMVVSNSGVRPLMLTSVAVAPNTVFKVKGWRGPVT